MTKPRRAPGTPHIDISLLLDRTGSMADNWAETLRAVNTYARQMLEDTTLDARVRLTVFDRFGNEASIDVLRFWTKETWTDITPDDCKPRGNTPLWEAVGKVLTGLKSEERKDSTRVQLVIMTDGQENASAALWTKERVRALIAEAEQTKGWSVVFLGAGLDTWVGEEMGTRYGSTMTYAAQNSMATMAAMASHTHLYAATGQHVNFSQHDRNTAVQGGHVQNVQQPTTTAVPGATAPATPKTDKTDNA